MSFEVSYKIYIGFIIKLYNSFVLSLDCIKKKYWWEVLRHTCKCCVSKEIFFYKYGVWDGSVYNSVS